MLTIAITNLKGGVGKSTVALHLAAYLHTSMRVVLVDTDPQGTCALWAQRSTDNGKKGPPVMSMPGGTLGRDLAPHAPAFDLAIIDTPPRMNATARSAILIADLVVVPCVPSAADIWATTETVSVIHAAQAMRPQLVARILMNRTDRTAIGRRAMAAVGELTVPLCDASLAGRVAYAEAFIEGVGVTDLPAPTDAASDLRRVARELLGLLGCTRKGAAS